MHFSLATLAVVLPILPATTAAILGTCHEGALTGFDNLFRGDATLAKDPATNDEQNVYSIWNKYKGHEYNFVASTHTDRSVQIDVWSRYGDPDKVFRVSARDSKGAHLKSWYVAKDRHCYYADVLDKSKVYDFAVQEGNSNWYK